MTWRERFLTVGVGEAMAVAAWLLPASVHIVQWPASGPVRLALLLPAWQLAVAVIAGLVLSAAMMALGVSARRIAPLLVLWLWVVPYLPWIPDRLPLLLVLAGPLRWILLAVAVLAMLSRTDVAGRLAAHALSLSRPAIFAASFAAYAATGLWAVHSHGLVGDEPHYLIIADSLMKDGDLQIENNHQRRDYRSYFALELRPDYMTRGVNNQIYSIHAPGLPALALPIYAVAGYRGVIVFIAFLAALAALSIFTLAERLAGRAAAVLTWLAVCFSVPFVPYAWMIFPEMPGALIVSWCALWLWDEQERSPRVWVWRSLALGLLPWLHTKFVLLAAVFGAAFALRLIRRRPALLAWILPASVLGVAWLFSFKLIYGSFNPESQYGSYGMATILFSNIPHGLIGILFDQKFGLLLYSPIYLAAIAGLWLLLRQPAFRWQSAVLVAAAGVFAGSTVRLYMFWGGSSAPARFLVPILPCLAPMIAMAVSHVRTALARGLVGLWIAIGAALAVLSMITPERLVLFSDPHGRARILELLQAGSPLSTVVPTFTDPDWTAHVAPLAAWMAASLIALGIAALLTRTRQWSAWQAVTVVSVLFVLGGAVVTSSPAPSAREATSTRGAIDVMTRFDGSRFRTLDYQTMRRASPEQLRQLTSLSITPLDPLPNRVGERGQVIAPVSLPPGRYETRIWFGSAAARRGEVAVEVLNQAVFAHFEGELQNPATVPFDLPVSVRRMMVRVRDMDAAKAVTRVELVPIAVVPPPSREPSPARTVESIPSRDGAFIAYIDENVYPERGSFWTRGVVPTTVLIAPAGAAKMTLTLSTGPMDSQVTVQFGKEAPRTLSMASDRNTTLSLDVPAGARLVPLTIGSSTMFRPAEVDPAARDVRGLGCQVNIAFE